MFISLIGKSHPNLCKFGLLSSELAREQGTCEKFAGFPCEYGLDLTPTSALSLVLRRGLILLFVLFGLANAATAQKDIRSYFFSNSLVHHLTDSDETAVPHWLNRIAQAAGHSYATNGQWGFVRQFAQDWPPEPNWSFDEVAGVWGPEDGRFEKAGFTDIVINPANFIQYQPPTTPFDGDNPDGASPVSATIRLFERMAGMPTDTQYFIYEGWAEMSGFSPAFPPSVRQLGDYHRYNLGAYHDWYVDYAEAMSTAQPALNIQLIPVASLLSKLLTETPLAKIPVTELYSDDAPHGTETLYFLAAAITYSWLYQEPVPTAVSLPRSVHAAVADNLPVISEVIWSEAKASGVVKGADVASASQTQPGPALGLSNPSLAMGLSGINDWSTQHPFIDVMKTARPWIGHLQGQWGGMDAAELEAQGFLDTDGWPLRVPETVDGLEALILTDQPPHSTFLTGQYRLRYTGEGVIALSGRAQNIRAEPGEIWFEYTPGDGPVGIVLSETDPKGTGNYIREISVVREVHIELFEVGAIFNPDWIAVVEDLRSVRFMDWMFTNGATVDTWESRPKPTDYTYAWRGSPVEVMVALANQTGADPWFNMPHIATDTYMRQFAVYVQANLEPGLKAYVEYSNELWNLLFPQAGWAQEQARGRWGASAGDDAWLQYSGMRAAEMAAIWAEVFGAEADDRLIRVIATHTGWPGFEESLLEAPLWMAETPRPQAPPSAYFDAYAVTGYFGHEYGSERLSEVLRWIAQSKDKAVAAASKLGLSSAAKMDYVAAHKFDLATVELVEDLKRQGLSELLTELWPYHAKVAATYGFDLVMYEGGTHIVGLEEATNNDELTEFFNHLNYTPEVADIYRDALAGWRRAGGTMFNAFVDVASASKWGSWGAMRNLQDENPRFAALAEFNKNTPGWWEDRAPGAFQNGGIFHGSDGNDTLVGTLKQDILLGRRGNDVLVASGDGDRLHGGAGHDIAVLRGTVDDYTFEWLGDLLSASGPNGRIWMYGIETVRFVP